MTAADGLVWTWWGTWWPWAEANQGLLSVAALIAALLVAVIEQRRANRADEASAAALVRAENRSREERAAADERSVREAREADDRLAKATMAERNRRATDFADSSTDLIGAFESLAGGELERLAMLNGNAVYIPQGVPEAAEQFAQSLRAILPAAPPHPEMVLGALRAAMAMEHLHRTHRSMYVSGAQVAFADCVGVCVEARTSIAAALNQIMAHGV